MKIHRIEVHNLNSLYGTHLVDLEATLQGASLFLIHGPTGSGKSTLMDAVSLALFGKTPRLDGARGDSSRDPREVMSRGSADCYSEVEFSKLEAGGRKRYRARWTCRRARRKAEGRLQDAERSIERLDGDGNWEVLISTKKQTDLKRVFGEVLEGFGVADFNRSMLLAQGQFDAFLRAPAAERAQILERLTNTTIYQQLGARAARLNRAHDQRLTALRTLAAAEGGQAPEVVAQLREAHATNEAELTARTIARDVVAAHLQWTDDGTVLQKQLSLAVEKQAAVAAEQAAAAADLARLAEHERCESSHAFRRSDEVTAAQARTKAIAKQLATLDTELPKLKAAEADREQEAAAAVARLDKGMIHLETLRPLAQEATATRRANEANAKLASEAAVTHESVAAASGDAEKAVTLGTAELATARAVAAQARAALEENRSDADLSAAWPDLRAQLDRLVMTTEGLDADALELTRRERALAEDTTALAEEREKLRESWSNVQAPLSEAVDVARASLAAVETHPTFEASREEAAASVGKARDILDATRAATGPVMAVSKGADVLINRREALLTLSRKRNEIGEALEVLKQAVAEREASEARSRAAMERTRRVADLAQHRIHLVDDEPCPLCGAEEHPWSGDTERKKLDAEIQEAVRLAETAHAETAQALEVAQKSQRTAEDEISNIDTRHEVAADLVREATQEQSVLSAKAKAALEAASLAEETTPSALQEALEAAETDAQAAQQLADALQANQDNLLRAEQALRDAVSDHNKTEATLQSQAAMLTERRTAFDADSKVHTTAAAKYTVVRDACRAQLESHALSLDQDEPSRWREIGLTRCNQHTAREKAERDATVTVEKLEIAHRENLRRRTEVAERLAETAKALTQRETAWDATGTAVEAAMKTLQLSWRHTLAAEPARNEDSDVSNWTPAAFVEAQELWVRATRTAATDTTSAHATSQKAVTVASTQREVLAAEQTKNQDAATKLAEKLNAALAGLEISADELAERRLDNGVLSALRTRRKDLSDRSLAAATLTAERRAFVDTHLGKRPEAIDTTADRATLQERSEAAQAAFAVAAAAYQETRDQLRDHERSVEKQAANKERLLAAEADARIWKTLHEYIGVNDGVRFKEFAQALNLGQLLDNANRHLAELEPRYRLIPRLVDGLPSLEFDLADSWQAGQTVAPPSLSGGERFLVSLALALGLSDFRSVRMPVETLLLDEGFGTLDSGTLGVALAALSQLRANGRQIGIISHVVGLRERIEARIEVRPLGAGRSEVRAC